ncbi:MAG: hypothetical protein PUK76_05065 [Treponema sp.]|nr:hypothetical protein [Treponema sp.]MDY2923394.1 hypothetical protein [Treponema sp.]
MDLSMNEILEIQSEVKSFADKIIDLSKTDKTIKELYKGVQIHYSPIRKNPKFMFLGINPGAGYFNYHDGECVYKFDGLDEIEYLSEDFQLAREWRYIFGSENNMLDRMDLLESAYKTNLYYVATGKQDELYKLLHYMKNEYGLEKECFTKPKEWLKKIVKFVNPESIICEGFTVLNELKIIFGNNLDIVNEPWGNNENFKVGYLKFDDLSITIFACARIYSNLKNREEVADIIRDEMSL